MANGIPQLTKTGDVHLLNPAKLTDRVTVPARLIRDYHLPEGAIVAGSKEGSQLATTGYSASRLSLT